MSKKRKLQVNWKHSEEGKNEIYIGNSNKDNYDSIKWKTKRKGKIPYNVLTNQPIKNTTMFPVFIERSEYQEYTYGVEAAKEKK